MLSIIDQESHKKRSQGNHLDWEDQWYDIQGWGQRPYVYDGVIQAGRHQHWWSYLLSIESLNCMSQKYLDIIWYLLYLNYIVSHSYYRVRENYKKEPSSYFENYWLFEMVPKETYCWLYISFVSGKRIDLIAWWP